MPRRVNVAKGMLGSDKQAVKVHHLVKAPENSPESIKIRESWDAQKPATVYKTPERLPDGTPCTAAVSYTHLTLPTILLV